ncbi:hypothetical protein Hypma_009392 [Hypsizygus marmoreus]|uniref:Uncharacterized protein n=1 Tax=Hypsizygus marmoreus TaxID=39966 RepID=A0A369JMM6_HYPMA|nr:hypothetical protein Hypma_009392 [Hypsizygus marmoreus]
MSLSTKQKAITYSDAVRAFNASDVQADLDDACRQLALSAVRLLDNFEYVAKQLHTIDLLGLTSPFKPQWISLRKDFRDLLWHFRSNAGIISGRLKMFCTVVLPLAARNSGGSRSHDEKIQVLRSYMSISADHAALTRNLVGNAIKFNHSLNAFHLDFSKFASQNAPSCQREMRALSQKLIDLENHIRQLYHANGKCTGLDVTHLAFSAFRLSGTSTRKTSRGRYSHQRLALNIPDLVSLGRLYEQLDLTRNEVAHAQYTAQVCHRKTDAITTAQTTMSTIVFDEMIAIESGLSLFLSIWSRLQCDCTDILQWLQNPRSHPEVPHAIISLLDGGHTLYATMADALDSCVMGIDPSHFTKP